MMSKNTNKKSIIKKKKECDKKEEKCIFNETNKR